jgi:hypothetical protein
MKDMKINSVKLVNSGLKGIEVKYALPNNKNNVSFIDEITQKKKAPIHEELEKTFGWLKGHLLDICGYSLETREKDIIDTEMVSITYNSNGFILVGKKSILDSEKTINLVTPLISSPDEYNQFSKVLSILDGIYAETKAYMAGDKVFSEQQLVLKFNKNNEEFDEQAFLNLPIEEQTNIAAKVLEGLGALVIMAPEIGDVNTPEEITPVDSTKSVEPKMEVVQEEVAEIPVIAELQQEGEEFNITFNMPPAKVSTAKRKVS